MTYGCATSKEERCIGKTLKGKRCKRPIFWGEHCHLHMPVMDTSKRRNRALKAV